MCRPRTSVTADGTNIRPWGQRSIILNFGQRRFVWVFRLASVDRPILGADFFAANNLIVYVPHQQLLDAASSQSLLTVVAVRNPAVIALTSSNYGAFYNMLKDFPKFKIPPFNVILMLPYLWILQVFVVRNFSKMQNIVIHSAFVIGSHVKLSL